VDGLRPALRYLGSKWRLARWIAGFFPPHIDYCEPFGGSASVLLQKPLSDIESYNDLDGELVNFWQVLRTDTESLIRQIDLTPYSEQEWRESFAPADDPLERARRFYVQSWMSFTPFRIKSGWRQERKPNRSYLIQRDEFARTEHLWFVAKRLKCVQVYNRDYREVIEYHNTADSVLYVDPPYLHSTRTNLQARYLNEMNDSDHVQLAEMLHATKASVILSGYDNPLYAELYQGWGCESKTATTNGNSVSVETVWVNPAAMSRQVKTLRLPGFE